MHLTLGVLGALASLAASMPAAAAPNFVIVYTDDMGYRDLSCYGAPAIKTPRLDRMAAEGARFTTFYTGSTTCSPSRAAVLTGCYPNRVGFRLVLGPLSPTGLDPKEITIAEMLKQKGYATAAVGKWAVGDQKPFLPTRQGFDTYMGMPNSNDSDPKYRVIMRGEDTVERVVDQSTLIRRYTDEALGFIAANRSKPFFLYLAHNAPHVPLVPSEAFKGRSAGGIYGDVIEELDWHMGRFLDSLGRWGLDSNTLVVFTSDNGPWLAQGANGGSALPLRGGKSSDYEGGLRVPGIMRWKGRIAAGRVVADMASAIDLYPTFAALAGITLPALPKRDGLDLTGLLLRGEASPRKEIFFRTNWSPSLTAVRLGDWKYRTASNDGDHTAPEGLHDLAKDPYETINLIISNPAKAAELRKILADKVEEIRLNTRPMANINTVSVPAPRAQGNASEVMNAGPGRPSARFRDALGRAFRVFSGRNIFRLPESRSGRGVSDAGDRFNHDDGQPADR